MKKQKIIATLLSAGLCLSVFGTFNTSDVSAAGIKLSTKKVTIKEKGSAVVKVKGISKKAKVTYKLKNKSIAKLTSKVSKGKKAKVKVVGKKKGNTILTVTVKDGKRKKILTCKVIVKSTKGADSVKTPEAETTPSNTEVTTAPVVNPTKTPVVYTNPVTKVVFDEDDYVTVEVGDNYTFATKLTPADGEPASIEYVSAIERVATVDDKGVLTAKYPGMVKIDVKGKVDGSTGDSVYVKVVDTAPAPEGFDSLNPSIEHGTVTGLNYNSDYREGGMAHAQMWLPPDYSIDKKYNVLFCLHGGMDDEYYWTNNCSGDDVLDRAYADKIMEDTIVVFTSGVIPYVEGKDYPGLPKNPVISSWGRDHYLLEFEIINNLLPFLKENYPIMEGNEHTAVCGLSMGGGQTLDIGLKNPEIFGYVGCFSAGPFMSGDQQFVTCEEDVAKLNSTLKFFSIMVGSEDFLGDNNVRIFEQTCTEYGVSHLFVEEQGLGHEDRCWNRNLYKFMKYAFK